MDPVRARSTESVPGGSHADRMVRAFRATDAFTIEVFQAARVLPRTEGEGLAGEIRRLASRTGGALVSASLAQQAPNERRDLERVRAGLMETRYLLYLSRRLGWFDLRRYRALARAQDVALREIEALLVREGRGPT